jgi:hypothetical protein
MKGVKSMPNPIPETLAPLKVGIATLTPFDGNPRRGDLDGIVESLRVHGQYRPIVVRKDTNEVLAGNHTLAAAKKLGWTEIAATFIECSDTEAKRIVLVDNRLNDVAEYDDRLLAELLGSLDEDLMGTGYEDADLEKLIKGLAEASEDDWAAAASQITEGDPAMHTMTFSLTPIQYPIVQAVIDTVIADLRIEGGLAGNKNGAALFHLAEVYDRG